MEQNIKKIKIILIGKTNVGKSTLFNNIINKEVSVVTDKKNTTIRALEVFCKTNKFLINLIDLPGPIVRTRDKHNINKIIYDFINNSDLILFVLEKNILKTDDFFLFELIKKSNSDVYLIINKIDKFFCKKDVLSFISKFKNFNRFKKIIPVSSKKKINIDLLSKEIGIPEKKSNFLIQNKNFILKDVVRYSLLSNLKKELPYCLNFDLFLEKNSIKENIINIKLYIKKNSQKRLIIGLNGNRINKIKKTIEQKLKLLYKKKYLVKINIQKNDN